MKKGGRERERLLVSLVVGQSGCWSVCKSVSLSVCQSVSQSVCLSVSQSVSL